MTFANLEYDNSKYQAELKLTDTGLIALDGDFTVPVMISLFTWRRDDNVDVAKTGNRYGWWADALQPSTSDRIGSRLWTLRREKNTLETQQKLQRIIAEALEWMTTLGIAQSIDVETERFSNDVIAAKVSITRASGGRWEKVWRIHLNAI